MIDLTFDATTALASTTATPNREDETVTIAATTNAGTVRLKLRYVDVAWLTPQLNTAIDTLTHQPQEARSA